MYRRMLVPLDGSELAETVLPYAAEVAGRLDLDVVVFHAYRQQFREHAPMHRAYIERGSGRIRSRIELFNRTIGTGSVLTTQQVSSVLVVGHPAEEILRYADDKEIDLILMATHGRSGIQRWAMGSVAAKVLRASKVPVWLVPSGSQQNFVDNEWQCKTIVVPLDGSKLAETVLPHVEILVNQWGSSAFDIALINVCESPFVTADYPEGTMPLNWEAHVTDIESRFKQASQLYLYEVEERLRKAGLNVHSDVLIGKPASVIIEYAKKYPSSMVAMSSHGRSGPMRWAYGSVADKVVHGASCPILLIRSH